MTGITVRYRRIALIMGAVLLLVAVSVAIAAGTEPQASEWGAGGEDRVMPQPPESPNGPPFPPDAWDLSPPTPEEWELMRGISVGEAIEWTDELTEEMRVAEKLGKDVTLLKTIEPDGSIGPWRIDIEGSYTASERETFYRLLDEQRAENEP